MLDKLCAFNGVSGDELSISKYIVDNITADDVKIKTMINGNIIVEKEGRRKIDVKFSLYAHMDEVGFIVTDITEDGFIKFDTVGGIDQRILLSKKVYIGENHIPGIIGIKAIHLFDKEARKKAVPTKNMYIDIGALNKANALKYVSLGDYIAFDNISFENGKSYISKAIDDRVGIALLLRLINSDCEYGFTVCFDVMEEVGARGALTATYSIKPDYALIVEGTTCSDINKTPEHLRSTVLGRGPALSVRDMGTCYNEQLNNFIKSLAEKEKIPFQLKQTHKGGNDSSAVQSASHGVKTAVMSVPVRYIHSPFGLMNLNDYENGYKLLKAITDNIGELI